MSLLSELTTLISALNIPVETGVFTDKAPDTYIVIVPLSEKFDLKADDKPNINIEEARLSLYTKTNYTTVKNNLVRSLLSADITITARQYIGYETETGYHHYNVDVADYFEIQEESEGV